MKRREYYEEQKLKKLVKIFSITLVLSIVVFLSIFVMYNKRLRMQSEKMISDLSKVNDIVPNDNLEEASYSDDLTIEKAENKSDSNSISNTSQVTSTNANQIQTENNVEDTENKVSKEPVSAEVKEEDLPKENEEVEVKELKFEAPVSGEIIKDYALDTLIYSKTLEEWTTHPGIDIKGNKTSIVLASEAGTVESIKNDPRYGLTITISHGNGFKTAYSNLLTTEFVKEGEVVEKGQTIATIGDTSSFEIADDSHLHFEMYKDGVLVNPTIYLK